MSIPNYFPEDPRSYLRDELQSRKRRRPHYSLRAFARDLEMSPSFLCEFLAGRQGLSRERVLWITQRLEMTPDQGEHFWDLIESRFGRSATAKRSASLRAMQRTRGGDARLALERFQIIAEWYHFAIVEMLALDGEQMSVKDLAAALDVGVAVVREALERLQAVGLIVRDADDTRWNVIGDTTVVGDEGASPAVRQAQQDMLNMQAQAVEKRGIDARESLSAVFTIDDEKWPAFKRELKESLTSVMGRFASEGTRKNQVVCMSMQALALLGEKRP